MTEASELKTNNLVDTMPIRTDGVETGPEVLVVGAGPSGLVLALTLLRNGVTVRLIDKNPEERIGQRGAGIMPRSLELFSHLGILPEVQSRAQYSPPCCIYSTDGSTEPIHVFEMAPYIQPTPSVPNPNILLLGQDGLEGILREELSAMYGCHIERGVELVTYEQHSDYVIAHLHKTGTGRVEGVEKVKFSWVVGTDGAKGVVRKLLGCTFLGETRNLENLVVGDIRVKSGLDRRFWHMWGDASTTLVSLRPTEDKDDNLYNFLLAGHNIDMALLSSSYDHLVQMIYTSTGRKDIEFDGLAWCSNYRPNIRMVDKFGEGRVLIAGDAAHVHSPTGGQGMNTGIQDSFNLGWKLALIQKGLAPMSLLESYDEERLPVIAEMLNQTTALLEKSFKKSNLSTSQEEGQSAWHRGEGLHQLSVNYRWSSIVVDEMTPKSHDNGAHLLIDSYGPSPDGLLHAGDRAPDASHLQPARSPSTMRLFRLFSCSNHTALVFASSAAQYRPIVAFLRARFPRGTLRTLVVVPQSAGEDVQLVAGLKRLFVGDGAKEELVVRDGAGHAYGAYGIKAGACRVVVVRPDGVIGAIVHGIDGLERYVNGVFVGDIGKAL